MTTDRRRTAAWRAAIVAAYVARPWSCDVAIGLVPRVDDDPYHTPDPHGFASMAAWGSALLLGPLVLALLLQRRPVEATSRTASAHRWRGAAGIAVLGTPMLMQWSAARMPIAQSWPVLASAALWLALVVGAAFNTGPVGPSLHGAFDRRPLVSWLLLLAIAVPKVGFAIQAAML